MTVTTDTSDPLLREARELLPDLVDLRRRIHRHPELGLELPATQAAVLDALDGLDLEVRTGADVSWIVADLVGRAPGPTILLRADMDALPMPEDTDVEYRSEVDGAMHACGHDAHTAMLVGAARLLHERRGSFEGTVRLAFQPGEEGFHGARVMLEEGLLDDPRPQAAFALHVTPNIPSGMVVTRGGALMASADEVTIRVAGRGGHASTPHLGNDPIPVAAEIVGALQTFVTRRVDVFDPAVVTIARLVAGTTDNVVPEVAEMLGTIRAVSERTRERVHEGVERVATGVAAAHEMTATVEIERGYPVTVNHPGFASFVLDVAREVVGDHAAFEMPSPVMGAEDFSYVLTEVPGAMAFLGASPPDTDPAHAPGCHSNRMTIDEEAMAVGVAVHVAVALEHLAGRFTG